MAAVLRSEPGLRRVATEASHSPESKASLVRSIFTGKVDAVVARPRGDRRGPPLDHQPGPRRTRSSSSGSSPPSGPPARRPTGSRTSSSRSDSLVKDNPSLRDALSDPARSIDDKRGLVRGLLEGKALPATIALVEQALAGTHRTVGVALHEYERVAAAEHGAARGGGPGGARRSPTPTGSG